MLRCFEQVEILSSSLIYHCLGVGELPIVLVEELSKSRTGKHAVRKIAFIVSKNGVRRVDCSSGEKGVKTYARGWSRICSVELDENEYAVQVHLVKNLYGHVKGYIEVYDHNGNMVFRAVYRKLKIRRSHGHPRYAWIVKRVAEELKLPVKRYNLGVVV